jgi:D-glycero-alpha-D-manno-heptose-7-phosphate kinase
MLGDQRKRSEEGEDEMLDNLRYIKGIGRKIKLTLEQGDTVRFGELMDEHWQHKKKRSTGMSNDQINRWYDVGMDSGAIGGKLVGAGAGGFLLFYAKDQDSLRMAMAEEGLSEVRFSFDHDGSSVIVRH